MKTISHAQAIQLIDRRADGMLKEDQRVALDEHLRACESCSAYSQQMELLPARLQHEFETRWDKVPGPSQRVLRQVTEAASRIPADSRRSANFRLLTGALALVILAFVINLVISQLQGSSIASNATPPVNSSARVQNRLLAFSSDQNGNYEIYAMHADGSGLTNLTNSPAADTYPFWSPDGRRIAFVSNRDGSWQIYLMDADGSNVIQLTQGEENYAFDPNGHTPWSPDGRKLIVSYGSPTEGYKLYAIDVTDKSITALTDAPGQYIFPSWSPDGSHIAFAADTGRIPRDLFIAAGDGTHLAKLTEEIRGGEFLIADYEWSSDGESLFFATNKKMYEATVDGQVTAIAAATDQILNWWDGGAVRLELGEERLSWVRSDGTQSTLDLCQDKGQMRAIAQKRSDRGSWVVGMNCSDGGWIFYWANAEGTTIQPLLNSILPGDQDNVFNMTWSPDDHYLALVGTNITSASPFPSTLYVMDVTNAREDASVQPFQMANSSSPSWQPAIENSVVEQKPTPPPAQTGSLIAFQAIGENGHLDIYTVHSDGSGLTNLTNDPADDITPSWSPDGRQIAFVSMRDGNQNIYVMNADGSDLRRLTDDPAADTTPVWSPDGTKIAYASGNFSLNDTDIYVAGVDGQSRRLITDFTPKTIVFPRAWTPDSQFVLFNVNGRIVQANANGGEITPITPKSETNTDNYVLARDASTFSYLTECNEGDSTFCYRLRAIRWGNPRADFTKWLATFKTPGDVCPIGQATTWTGSSIKWSPDQTKILFIFTCQGSGWMYLANADGSDFRLLASYPLIAHGDNQGAVTGDWSPDSQSIIFMAWGGEQGYNLYRLSVRDALQNPGFHPTLLDISTSQISQPAWQPAPNDEAVKAKSTPGPTSTPLPFSLTVQEAEKLAGFDIRVPSYLPEGYAFQGAAYDPQSHAVTLQYLSSPADPMKRCEISIYQKLGDFPDFSKELGLPSQSYETPAPVGNVTGSLTHGAWVYEASDPTPRWDASADIFSLKWQSDGMSFMVDFLGGGMAEPIDSHELVAIAESLTSTPAAQPFSSLGTDKSNGEWIAFIASSEEIQGPQEPKADVFISHPDGTEITNLTQFPAHYYDLQWSPDGKQLLFMRQSSSPSQLDILRSYAGSAGASVLTRPITDPDHYGYSWSPKSDKILFADASNGNYDLYTIYADGRNDPQLTQLTNDPGQDVGFAWSPDGSQIAFQRLQGDQLSILVMNQDGSNPRQVASGSGKVKLSWSNDGASLYASSLENNWLACEGCAHKPAIYQIDLSGPSTHQIYYEGDAAKAAGWYLYETPQNTLYFMRIAPPAFLEFWGTWMVFDGRRVQEIGALDPQQTCKTSSGNLLSERISSNERFSVISNFCAGGFDLYLADRQAATAEQKLIHLLRLPPDTSGQGGDFATLPMAWSPDGRWLIYDNGNRSVYLLNVEQMLQEPGTPPALLFGPEDNLFQVTELTWQPIP